MDNLMNLLGSLENLALGFDLESRLHPTDFDESPNLDPMVTSLFKLVDRSLNITGKSFT